MKLQLPDSLIKDLQVGAKINNVSISKQGEYWLRLAALIEDNPDMCIRLAIGLTQAKQPDIGQQ